MRTNKFHSKGSNTAALHWRQQKKNDFRGKPGVKNPSARKVERSNNKHLNHLKKTEPHSNHSTTMSGYFVTGIVCVSLFTTADATSTKDRSVNRSGRNGNNRGNILDNSSRVNNGTQLGIQQGQSFNNTSQSNTSFLNPVNMYSNTNLTLQSAKKGSEYNNPSHKDEVANSTVANSTSSRVVGFFKKHAKSHFDLIKSGEFSRNKKTNVTSTEEFQNIVNLSEESKDIINESEKKYHKDAKQQMMQFDEHIKSIEMDYFLDLKKIDDSKSLDPISMNSLPLIFALPIYPKNCLARQAMKIFQKTIAKCYLKSLGAPILHNSMVHFSNTASKGLSFFKITSITVGKAFYVITTKAVDITANYTKASIDQMKQILCDSILVITDNVDDADQAITFAANAYNNTDNHLRNATSEYHELINTTESSITAYKDFIKNKTEDTTYNFENKLKNDSTSSIDEFKQVNSDNNEKIANYTDNELGRLDPSITAINNTIDEAQNMITIVDDIIEEANMTTIIEKTIAFTEKIYAKLNFINHILSMSANVLEILGYLKKYTGMIISIFCLISLCRKIFSLKKQEKMLNLSRKAKITGTKSLEVIKHESQQILDEKNGAKSFNQRFNYENQSIEDITLYEHLKTLSNEELKEKMDRSMTDLAILYEEKSVAYIKAAEAHKL